MSKARQTKHIILAIAVVLAITGCCLWPAFKARSQAAKCSSQMHVILYAAVFDWSAQHSGYLPDSLIAMSNELVMSSCLVCPSDPMSKSATDWSNVTTNNCSYELVTTNLQKGNTNQIFHRCPIHGYVGYADGRLVETNGNLIQPQRVW